MNDQSGSADSSGAIQSEDEDAVENPSPFLDYKSLLQQTAKMEEKLDSKKARSHAPNTYDELRIAHAKFLRLLQRANNEEQRLIESSKRQMTMNDFFTRSTSE